MSLWPDGKQAAALFSFDVDCEAGVLFADERNASQPITMSQFTYGATIGTFEILRVLRRHDVRATFFIPTYTAERHPDTLKAVLDEGHEIGLHGHLHEPPFKLDPLREREILEKSTEILERMTGRRPVGYRAPWAEVNPSTVSLLASHGLEYDSSFMGDVFPSYHRGEDGLPDLVELPIHWSCDDWGYSLVAPHVIGAPEQNVVRTATELITLWGDARDGIREMGGLFTPVGHPEVSGRPNRLRVLDEIIASVVNDDGFWVGTAEEIAKWWRDSGAQTPTGLERLNRPFS